VEAGRLRDPLGRFVPAGLPREPLAVPGARRRAAHLSNLPGDIPRARGNYPAELHAKLSPHGQPDDLKGVGLSGAADTLLTTLNYLADACACTSPAQSRQDRGSSSYDRNRQE